MRDVVYLDQIEQAEALLKPQRIEVLRQLAEPRSCTEVAAELDQTPQRVYYHVKRLVDASLVSQVSERRVRGIHEGIYQATGRSYWLSPRLVGRIGLRQTRDRLSLGYLLDLMEDVQADVAALDLSRSDLPSIGVSGDIRVRPEQRAGVPRRAAAPAAGPVHPLWRRRGRRVPPGPRLLPEPAPPNRRRPGLRHKHRSRPGFRY